MLTFRFMHKFLKEIKNKPLITIVIFVCLLFMLNIIFSDINLTFNPLLKNFDFKLIKAFNLPVIIRHSLLAIFCGVFIGIEKLKLRTKIRTSAALLTFMKFIPAITGHGIFDIQVLVITILETWILIIILYPLQNYIWCKINFFCDIIKKYSTQ